MSAPVCINGVSDIRGLVEYLESFWHKQKQTLRGAEPSALNLALFITKNGTSVSEQIYSGCPGHVTFTNQWVAERAMIDWLDSVDENPTKFKPDFAFEHLAHWSDAQIKKSITTFMSARTQLRTASCPSIMQHDACADIEPQNTQTDGLCTTQYRTNEEVYLWIEEGLKTYIQSLPERSPTPAQ